MWIFKGSAQNGIRKKVKILIKRLKEIFKIMYKSHIAKLRNVTFSISIYSGNEKTGSRKWAQKICLHIII
jgi:hypothetical protein